ncbi:SMP-30/gluconolactonase/LRE family protein [Micromonospora sp. NPDC005237]|uniref:SMP-30/gluconolactonase/LRE family protein n=1 Tax=Micromonospora sp. NPDC005237 TaxID=3155113 RepID=UPI0033A38FC4
MTAVQGTAGRPAQLVTDEPLRQLTTGYLFTEGPSWHPHEQSLTFTDIPAGRIFRLDAAGDVTAVRDPSNKANGTAYDRQGRLVVCEHATSRLVRRELDGSWTTLADRYDGRELNSPNDVIVASDGTIYFTDPPYGRTSEFVGVLREVPLDVCGVYRLVPDTGELTLLIDDLDGPNGLCLSLDESVLYVNDTEHGNIRRFRLQDGRGTGGEVFAVTSGPGDPVVDGLKIDSTGNVYCTGPGGIHVYSPDGAHLGVIEVPEVVGNFVWGGEDLCTLYICASTSVYSVRTTVAGLAAF